MWSKTKWRHIRHVGNIHSHFSESLTSLMIHSVWLHNEASSQNTPNSRLRNSRFSTGAVGWLLRATLETLSDSLHIILRHVRSSCAFAFTQTSCFLELPIPPTDALSTRWFNSVTSTELTLHCDYRYTLPKLQHTKRLLLYGRHFLTDYLSRSHSDSGVISRWPSKTRWFPLSFGGCQVNTRLMGTGLCSFEIGWIILNNAVRHPLRTVAE
jgi:hypothetical protein